MDNNYLRLPDGELEVMRAIWDLGRPATRKDIQKRIASHHPIAVTTLLTFLSRLADKGFVSVDHDKNKNVYTAAVPEHDYLKQQGREFIKKVCGGNLHAFATALCDGELTPEDIDELIELLEAMK